MFASSYLGRLLLLGLALALGVVVVAGQASSEQRIAIDELKAAIDAGKIGIPILGTFSMFSWRDQAYYRSDPWRGKWASEGGGVLVNQSPHMLDMLQWFMGEIEEISGYWANLILVIRTTPDLGPGTAPLTKSKF